MEQASSEAQSGLFSHPVWVTGVLHLADNHTVYSPTKNTQQRAVMRVFRGEQAQLFGFRPVLETDNRSLSGKFMNSDLKCKNEDCWVLVRKRCVYLVFIKWLQCGLSTLNGALKTRGSWSSGVYWLAGGMGLIDCRERGKEIKEKEQSRSVRGRDGGERRRKKAEKGERYRG